MDNKPKVYCYIRFSTVEQEEGDSFRRQFNKAKEYAEKHGFTLNESQTFTDLGISGYKGINKNHGELKDFIDLVDKGEIPHGSILIVEHLDRLSREKTGDALTLFLYLINKGIKIVTLQDNIEYDKDSINNQTQLILSIMHMASAHDESLKKSIRIREALEKKIGKLRNNEIKIYSAKCPLWVKLSDDKTKFVPIPEVCEAIELIFKKRLEGKGSYKIEKELNLDTNVWKPPISGRNKTGGWRDAYINKILRNRKLLGEYQPHEMKTKMITKNGKEEERSIPVAKGDPIKDYYPKVIDEGLFYKVQELIKQNGKFPGNGGGGGNKDKGSNLFTHVVKCGICGCSMQFVDKGIQYLICDSKRRKNKIPIRIRQDSEFITVEKVCTSKSVRYDEFERIFLENVKELDIDSLLPNEDETTRIKKQKENELAKNKHELEELESQLDYLTRLLLTKRDKETLERFDRENDEIKIVVAKLKEANNILIQDIEDLAKQRDTLKKRQERIKEVCSFLESGKDEQERINRRFQLRQEIQNMIERIDIYAIQVESKANMTEHKIRQTIDNIVIRFKTSTTLSKIIFVTIDGEQVISRRRTNVHN